MAQEVIGEHAGHHRLANRHGADADAGIVAPFGDDLGVVSVAINRATRRQDRGGRLHGEAHDDGLAGRQAAQHAAGMIGQKRRLAIRPHRGRGVGSRRGRAHP